MWHILAVSCMWYLHAWGCLFTKYFEILYIFAQISALFALFFAPFLKNACMPLLSRIGPGQSVYSVSPPCWGGGGAVPNFEKGGSEKKLGPGGT